MRLSSKNGNSSMHYAMHSMHAFSKLSNRCLLFHNYRKTTARFATNTSHTSSPKLSLVSVEDRDGVTLIGLNRPETRNCVDVETADQLVAALQRFDSSQSSVAVLHGNGGTFCAGFDLPQLSQFCHNSALFGANNFIGLKSATKALSAKPIIASIDGYAVDGGLELALLCDLRVMEENAVLGLFCGEYGVPVINGATVRLTKMIGLSRALDMILTGRPIGAKEAQRFGLVNSVVAVGTALGIAFNLAHSLIKFPQQCVEVDRRSVGYASYDAKSLEDALKFEYDNGRPVIDKESIKGATRFINEGLGRHGTFVLDKFDNKVDVSV